GCRFFFSSRRRHTRFSRDWSSDVCSSDLSGGSMIRPVCPVTHPAPRQMPGRSNGEDMDALIKSLRPNKPADAKPGELDPSEFMRSEERRVGKGCRAKSRPGSIGKVDGHEE